LLNQVEAVIAAAGEAGVTRCVNAATDVADSRAGVGLARRHDGVYCTAGVHPHEAAGVEQHYLRQLEEIAAAGAGKCVAVGEIGLDYHYDFSPRDVQRRVFVEQLQLAARLGKPVVIHTREADEDTLAILAEQQGRLAGVIHSFTGGPGAVERYLEQGWRIGFAGIVTFKRSGDNREAAKLVPADRILIETDAPFLTPEPMRKIHPNTPAMVVHTGRRLAELRSVAEGEFARQTAANAEALFGLG
jgi:TatD DNase family protein